MQQTIFSLSAMVITAGLCAATYGSWMMTGSQNAIIASAAFGISSMIYGGSYIMNLLCKKKDTED